MPSYNNLEGTTMSNQQTIELLPLIQLDDSKLTYAQRLQVLVDHSPSHITINLPVTPYAWSREANAKRPVK